MNNKGFTLAEVLIVIVVMGIIGSFGSVSVSEIIENQRKGEVYADAMMLEQASRLYCLSQTCQIGDVLGEDELDDYITNLNDGYTYEVTVHDGPLYSVVYYKEGDYSYPFKDGTFLSDLVPTRSSKEDVSKYIISGETESNNPISDQPIIPEGEPYILLNGPSTAYVEIANQYNDPGVTAYTSEGDVINYTWKSTTPDYWTLGTYEITYECYSRYDRKQCIPATRTIVVVDTTPPVININGSSTVTASQWGYWDAGAWASDNSYESIQVITTGVDEVDVTTPGTYYITYTAVDSSGNEATAVRTVIVN
jgi:prepilin-type N-terminal cleavage/methylation domain-containing protein